MKCPMTFGDPCYDRDDECRHDCAWLVERGVTGDTYCAVAVLASSETDSMGFGPVNIERLSAKGGE